MLELDPCYPSVMLRHWFMLLCRQGLIIVMLYSLAFQQAQRGASSLSRMPQPESYILMKVTKFSHITPVLASLQWLHIQARADFKVLL